MIYNYLFATFYNLISLKVKHLTIIKLLKEPIMRKLTSVFLLLILILSTNNSILASEEKKISKTFDVANGGDLFLQTDKGSTIGGLASCP